MIKHITITVVVLIIAAFSGPAMAQEEQTGPTTREMMAAQLSDYKSSLNISDYQWTQVEMILKSSIRERLAIAQRYGLDGSGEAYKNLEKKQKRRLKKELKGSRENAEDRMKRYLDKEQFKEFKAVQETIHQEFIARAEQLDAS